MRRVFILEDDPMRIRAFREVVFELDATFAESCDEAVQKFQPPYDLVCLDHDLGGQQMVAATDANTGSEFCRRIASAPSDAANRVVVHSYNPEGARSMVALLREKGYRVIQQPFGPTVLGWLRYLVEEAA